MGAGMVFDSFPGYMIDFRKMRRAAMPMQLIRNLEDTVDRQAVASRSEGYVGRFSPEQRVKLKDGTYDYNGLTRDYYDLVTSFYEYGWGESFHFAPPSSGSTTTKPRLRRRWQERRRRTWRNLPSLSSVTICTSMRRMAVLTGLMPSSPCRTPQTRLRPLPKSTEFLNPGACSHPMTGA